MKIVTICIICSEKDKTIYQILEPCILLKEDIEILVIGEENHPGVIEARRYALKYAEDITVHISTPMQALPLGIEKAKGLYFKAIENKDSLDASALVKVVQTFKDVLRIQANLDMMICDYEYPKIKKKPYLFEYSNVFPLDKVFQWHQTKSFKIMQKISLDSILIKTNILKHIDLHMSDNNYLQEMLLLEILPSIHSMYYLDKSLQQVTRKDETMMDLQEYKKMLYAIIEHSDVTKIESRKFRNYMINHIISLLLLFNNVTMKQDKTKVKRYKEEVMEHMIIKNPMLYRSLKKTIGFKLYTSDVKITNLVIAKKYHKMY